jgi:hypothetical protein
MQSAPGSPGSNPYNSHNHEGKSIIFQQLSFSFSHVCFLAEHNNFNIQQPASYSSQYSAYVSNNSSPAAKREHQNDLYDDDIYSDGEDYVEPQIKRQKI